MITSQDNVSVGNHAQFCPMFPFRDTFSLLLICIYVGQTRLEVYIVHIAGMMRWKWNVVGELLSDSRVGGFLYLSCRMANPIRYPKS